jgi:hypothetical protein
MLGGESDAKAVEVIQEAEHKVAEKGEVVTPAEKRAVDQAREQAFDKLRRKDFKGALADAEKCQGLAEEAGHASDEVGLEEKARGLARFGEYVLQRFDWALRGSPGGAQLGRLAAAVLEALAKHDRRALEDAVRRLEDVVNRLPEVVRVFLGMENVLRGQLQPAEPALAASLLEELQQVEAQLRLGTNVQAAAGRLSALAQKIEEGLKKAAARPGAQGRQCSKGHPVSGRICPVCGEDTMILGGER